MNNSETFRAVVEKDQKKAAIVYIKKNTFSVQGPAVGSVGLLNPLSQRRRRCQLPDKGALIKWLYSAKHLYTKMSAGHPRPGGAERFVFTPKRKLIPFYVIFPCFC